MISRFCGKCGKVNTEQTNFCQQCGQNLVAESSPSDAVNQPATVPQQPPPNSYQPFQEKGFPAPNAPVNPFQQNSGSPPHGFTPPPYVQSAYQSQQTPLSQTVSTQKTGIGGKILSAFGVIIVGLFFFLKGGLILLRLGSLGGVGLVIAIVVILAIIVIKSLVKRSRR